MLLFKQVIMTPVRKNKINKLTVLRTGLTFEGHMTIIILP